MDRSKLKLAGFILLILGGAYLIFCGLAANTKVPDLIGQAVNAYFEGNQVSGFGNIISGFISGGHLALVPMWQIRVALVLGWLMVSVGCIGIKYQREGKSIMELFRKEHWTNLN